MDSMDNKLDMLNKMLMGNRPVLTRLILASLYTANHNLNNKCTMGSNKCMVNNKFTNSNNSSPMASSLSTPTGIRASHRDIMGWEE